MCDFWLIDEFNKARLERVMKRLYTEDRMDSNEMRDSAQDIHAALSSLLVHQEGKLYD
jgi:hypothetical protein